MTERHVERDHSPSEHVSLNTKHLDSIERKGSWIPYTGSCKCIPLLMCTQYTSLYFLFFAAVPTIQRTGEASRRDDRKSKFDQ